VSDVIPSGLTLLSVKSSVGSCQGTTNIVCNLGNLAAGTISTIELRVHSKATGNITNTANLSSISKDPNLANNVAQATTQVYNPCAPPGAIMGTDPTGDQTGTTQQDLTSVAIAEPFLGANVNKLVFTLKVQNLSNPPQPNAYWYEHFSYGGVSYFVDMETASDATFTPRFHYGRFDVDPNTGINTQKVLGDADAGTFSTDGTITITLSNSKLNQDADPAPPDTGTPPKAGSVISGIHGETRNLIGVLLALADTTNGGAYTLSGNKFCVPNKPPVAVLHATPTSGIAPLAVSFNASTSSDPDAGDSIASFTFYFGDGSPPVTQSGPTISHTYANPGTYHATLTVTDSRGQESTNVAMVDIVPRRAAADLSVDKSGPATAHPGQSPIKYTIIVQNGGPDAATAVTAVDTLPKNAGFQSVSTTRGTCAISSDKTLVTCNIGTMASGATATVTIVISPTVNGSYTDTAKASATSPGDPNSGNNSDSVTTVFS
jgi:uncharacterized repeat protein (TIGR01451 family)